MSKDTKRKASAIDEPAMPDADTQPEPAAEKAAPEPDAKPAPAKKRRRTTDSKPRGSTRRKALKAPLEELFVGLGTGIMILDEYDGQVVVNRAPELAAQLDKLAKDNQGVQRALERLVSGSQWGSLVGVIASVAVPIAARHGIVPAFTAGLVGAEPPSEVRPLGRKQDQPEPESIDAELPVMPIMPDADELARALGQSVERQTAATPDDPGSVE